MASRLGWTVGITADDLVGAQCRAVIGLAPQDDKWLAETTSGPGRHDDQTPPNVAGVSDVVPHPAYVGEPLVVLRREANDGAALRANQIVRVIRRSSPAATPC